MYVCVYIYIYIFNAWMNQEPSACEADVKRMWYHYTMCPNEACTVQT